MKIAQTMALAAVLVALVVCGGASSSHDLAIAQNVPPQGDHTFRITHIKFDHTGPDANTSAEPTDGLRIRRDGRAKLKHEGNGAGAGEWVRGSNNEEALYVAGKRVTIKVRIECDDPVRTAVFSAIQKGVDPTLPPSLKPWTDVAEKQVEFQERPVGSGLWVSWNPTPGVSDPEYVEFDLTHATRGDINKSRCTWTWRVKDVDSSLPHEPPAPNPLQYDVEDTGPHVFYTVLDTPFEPWYAGDDKTWPWITALDFSIITLATLGITEKRAAAAQVTLTIWLDAVPRYDHNQRLLQSRYIPQAPEPSENGHSW